MRMNLKLCVCFFKVDCIILTKCFKVPYGGDPIFDATALMGYLFAGLCAFKVLYNLGGIQSDG